jgi:UBA/TS-N domain
LNLFKKIHEFPVSIQLVSFGFTAEMAKMALKTTINNQNAALDYLLKLQSDGTYATILNSLTNGNDPSTSSGLGSTMVDHANVLKNKVDEMKVYKRFTEDISSDEDSYLDLPLQLEEKLINDYKKFLNM